MSQNEVYDLLRMVEVLLDDGYSLFKYTVVNKREIESLIDRIYEAMPTEMREAKIFSTRKDELLNEAQEKAQKIIKDAQNEASRLVSESELRKAIERDGIRLKNEVVSDCENIKHTSLQDAEKVRLQATEEAMKIREGAEIYAKQVLTNLEENLTQLQQVVKNGQIYMEQIRNDTINKYAPQGPAQRQDQRGGWSNPRAKEAKKL